MLHKISTGAQSPFVPVSPQTLFGSFHHNTSSGDAARSGSGPSIDPEQAESEAIAFLTDLYGNPLSYGPLRRRNDGWITAQVGADKGSKRLPEVVSKAGRLSYLLPLKPRDITKAYRTGELIGKRPGGLKRGKTRHLTIDIDKGSQYHPHNDLAAWAGLITFLQDSGLAIAVVTSSDSGGLHIIVAFDRPLWSMAVAEKITGLLKAAGYTIAQGQLETFPNVPTGGNDTAMNGCRLPCITECSYLVDPYSLERIGWRVELAKQLKEAVALNQGEDFLSLAVGAQKEIHPQTLTVEVETKAEKTEQTTKAEKTEPKGFGQFVGKIKRAAFNLADRFYWSETNRSNRVIGAHAAYVIEVERITDPEEAEARVWERLHQHGYADNASTDEQRDVTHVRRWIAHCLKKGGKTPLGKPGRGDRRLNDQRSHDAQQRLRIALKGIRHQTFTTATALWNAANIWLKSWGFKGLGKTTFWKLKLYWLGALVKALLPPKGGSTPPLDQAAGQDDLGRARDWDGTNPPLTPRKRDRHRQPATPATPPRAQQNNAGGAA